VALAGVRCGAVGVIEAWWNERKLELPQDAAGLWFGIVELAEREWMPYRVHVVPAVS
jgi:hypothetical protein